MYSPVAGLAVVFGGFVIFAVLTFFISIIIYFIFRYSKNKNIAALFSLCFGLIGFVGLWVVSSAIDWQLPVLQFSFFVPVSWLTIGIIAGSKIRKKDLIVSIMFLLLLFASGVIMWYYGSII